MQKTSPLKDMSPYIINKIDAAIRETPNNILLEAAIVSLHLQFYSFGVTRKEIIKRISHYILAIDTDAQI